MMARIKELLQQRQESVVNGAELASEAENNGHPTGIRVAIDPSAPFPIYAVPEKITPEQAREWRNKQDDHPLFKNRKLSEPVVERYSHDMVNDLWLLTHQPIAISPEDVPIDGQHRLEALARSGQEQWMLVARNVPFEVMLAIDGGFKRGYHHVKEILGEKEPKTRASIVRMTAKAILSGENQRKLSTMVKGFSLSNPELNEWEKLIKEHVNIDAAIVNARKLYKPVPPAAGGAFFCLVSIEVSEEIAEHFIDAVDTGADLPIGDARLALRNTVIELSRRSKVSSEEYLCVLIKGFNAWAKGQSRKSIPFKKEENVPVISKGKLARIFQ